MLDISTAREEVILRRTDRTDLAGLLDRVRAHQRSIGRPEDVGDLIGFANEWLRREWEHRWPRRPRWLARRFPGRGPTRIEPG